MTTSEDHSDHMCACMIGLCYSKQMSWRGLDRDKVLIIICAIMPIAAASHWPPWLDGWGGLGQRSRADGSDVICRSISLTLPCHLVLPSRQAHKASGYSKNEFGNITINRHSFI